MLIKLAKDSAIYGVGDFLFKFIAFALLPVYTHIFSVYNYGLIELISTLVGFIGLFISLGLNNALQRFYWDPNVSETEKPSLVSSGFWTLTLWGLFVSSLVLVIFFLLKDLVREKYQIPFIYFTLALLTSVIMQFLQFCLDVLRLHFSPWKFTVLSAIKNLLGVALGLYLIIINKQGLFGYFFGAFLATILTVPFGLWSIRKDLRFSIRKEYVKELVSYGYPFIFAGLAYWCFGSLDRWMLGTLTNTTQVGLYSIAFKFASVITFVTSAFGQAWSPYAIKIYAENPDYRSIFGKMLSYWFFGLTALGVGITLFSVEVLHLLTPSQYWPAALSLGFIAMGVVFQGTTQITAFGISIERKSKRLTFIAWQTTIVNIIINFLLTRSFGVIGASIAMMCSYIFLSGSYLLWTQKLHPLTLEHKKILFLLGIIFITLLFSFILNSIIWSWWIVIPKVAYLAAISYGAVKLKMIPKLNKGFFLKGQKI